MDEEVAAAVDEMLNRRPAVVLGVGIVGDGWPGWFRGEGVADLDGRRAIAGDTGFRIASIPRTCPAVALAQPWETQRSDLDAPGRYLRSYRPVPARPEHRPPTVRHLPTDTSGLGELAHRAGAFPPDFGERVPAGGPVSSLAGPRPDATNPRQLGLAELGARRVSR